MYKILALDLDGTVLNSKNRINPDLVKTIQQIAKKVQVVIVTGRHHVAARPYYQELMLNTPIICCNGTYIYDYENEHVIAENSLDKQLATEFIALSEQQGLKMVMYVRDAMLYSRERPIDYMEDLLQWSKSFPEGEQPNIHRVDDFNTELQNSEYIWKFVVEGNDLDDFLKIDFVKSNFNGERSWVDRIDFCASGNSKGNRLAEHCKRLAIPLNECIAVGDNHNDISMLKIAGLSIAMQNAEQEVKSVADIVTNGSNDEDALSTLLSDLLL